MQDIIQAQTAATAEVAVGAASAAMGLALTEGMTVVVVSTTAAWVKFGTAPTAVGRTTGNHYIPPNVPMAFAIGAGITGAAIIQDAAGGFATIAYAVN